MIKFLDIAAITNTGLRRKQNEDSLVVGADVLAAVSLQKPVTWKKELFPVIIAVADGIGGSVAGDVASREVLSFMAKVPCPVDEKSLHDRIVHAQEHLNHLVDNNPDLFGLGTTLAGVLLLSERLIIFSCGDSRVYMRRPGETVMKLITRDHSIVQEMIDSGRLTEKEARSHPSGHIITSCLSGGGVRSTPDIRMTTLSAESGTRMVICTDGVWDYGGDSFIQAVLKGDPVSSAKTVLTICYNAGAPDNLTFIIADLN